MCLIDSVVSYNEDCQLLLSVLTLKVFELSHWDVENINMKEDAFLHFLTRKNVLQKIMHTHTD
jgi:hypothetical protein